MAVMTVTIILFTYLTWYHGTKASLTCFSYQPYTIDFETDSIQRTVASMATKLCEDNELCSQLEFKDTVNETYIALGCLDQDLCKEQSSWCPELLNTKDSLFSSCELRCCGSNLCARIQQDINILNQTLTELRTTETPQQTCHVFVPFRIDFDNKKVIKEEKYTITETTCAQDEICGRVSLTDVENITHQASSCVSAYHCENPELLCKELTGISTGIFQDCTFECFLEKHSNDTSCRDTQDISPDNTRLMKCNQYNPFLADSGIFGETVKICNKNEICARAIFETMNETIVALDCLDESLCENTSSIICEQVLAGKSPRDKASFVECIVECCHENFCFTVSTATISSHSVKTVKASSPGVETSSSYVQPKTATVADAKSPMTLPVPKTSSRIIVPSLSVTGMVPSTQSVVVSSTAPQSESHVQPSTSIPKVQSTVTDGQISPSPSSAVVSSSSASPSDNRVQSSLTSIQKVPYTVTGDHVSSSTSYVVIPSKLSSSDHHVQSSIVSPHTTPTTPLLSSSMDDHGSPLMSSEARSSSSPSHDHVQPSMSSPHITPTTEVPLSSTIGDHVSAPVSSVAKPPSSSDNHVQPSMSPSPDITPTTEVPPSSTIGDHVSPPVSSAAKPSSSSDNHVQPSMSSPDITPTTEVQLSSIIGDHVSPPVSSAAKPSSSSDNHVKPSMSSPDITPTTEVPLSSIINDQTKHIASSLETILPSASKSSTSLVALTPSKTSIEPTARQSSTVTNGKTHFKSNMMLLVTVVLITLPAILGYA